MTFKEEIQAKHPYLYGDKLDRMKEEDKESLHARAYLSLVVLLE